MNILVIPIILILVIFSILLGVGAFLKFFRRDSAAEKAVEEMVVTHRQLVSEIAMMQGKADAMKNLINESIDRLPFKSKNALMNNPIMSK